MTQTPPSLLPWLPFPLWSLRAELLFLFVPFFFGASLTALNKKGGGVRPIAVGYTLRRLVAKLAGRMVVGEMANLLAPRQLGYGVLGGAGGGSTSITCNHRMLL